MGMLADTGVSRDVVSAALHLDRDLELLGLLGDRLTGQGIRAEVREHLLSLLVFRGSALPVCVFVSGNGRFYSWESGRGREHVVNVDHAAAQLADLVRSPTQSMSLTPHALPVAFQRSYAGTTDQVALVRADLAQVAEGSPVADDLLLLASEISTNALMHSRSGLPGQTFTVRAELRPGRCAWLEVEDQGGDWVRRESDDEHGRGLAILACLVGAGNWGVELSEETGACVVWARLDWPRKAAF
jgi:anti-sigma regulatory factor (Ser/Thr protein kinase)